MHQLKCREIPTTTAVQRGEVGKQMVWVLRRVNSWGALTAVGLTSSVVSGERRVERQVASDRQMEVPVSPLTAEAASGDCSCGLAISF